MTEPQAEPTGQREVRRLACKITHAEFYAKATEFAQLDEQLETLETEKKAVVEDFKDRIGGVNAKRSELRRVVMRREEIRDVQCTWHADWASKSMLLRRDDTKEVVQVRTMTADEVQQHFDYRDKTVTPESNQLPEKTDDSEPLDA